MPKLSKESSRNIFDHPFLERGFRPFFFMGALYSMVSIALWGLFMAGPSGIIDPVSWHAHEMIYGYTIAIIAGFLLTAVANWTNGAPARKGHLALLCLLWLAGRISMNMPELIGGGIAMALELCFMPALAVTLAVPLLKSWNKRNFIFLGMLSVLFICDAVFLLTESRTPLYVALMVIIGMISLVGGRVIPAFTVAAIRRGGKKVTQTPQPVLDVIALVSIAGLILCFLFVDVYSMTFAAAAFISAAIHALRLRHYKTLKILKEPMALILHAAYIWGILGLLFMGLSALGIVPFSAALHALTVGCLGSVTLGMICRVTLGHTGRMLVANPLTVSAFAMMQAAAVLRVFGPLIVPEYSQIWILGSAGLWALCFGVYLVIYTPYLWAETVRQKLY